jgi:Uma2 family endonuclease
MATLPKVFTTPEQYLELERQAEHKSEYYAGEVIAMSGASFGHNVLATNLSATLHQQLRRTKCAVMQSDMRVMAEAGRTCVYPDVAVVCGPPRFVDQHPDTLLNPAFVTEILSPTTERRDRGFKSEYYRRIESLRQYLLVSQDRVHIELYTRTTDGKWVLTEANTRGDVIELDSIGCRVTLADLYEKLEFEESPAAE